MKKRLMSLLLICCMAFAVFACSKDSKYVGKWNLKEAQASGVTLSKEQMKQAMNSDTEITLELKSDGKASFSYGSKKYSGEWEEIDDGIKLKDETNLEFKEEDGNLAVETSGVKLVFEKAE